MSTPYLSIIVPVYNAEKYLRECLDSLCGQTFPGLEIVCVNDGSTDDSSNILKEYEEKDKRVKVITQENQGVSEARNNGISHAQGEYIGFVDSDDYVADDFASIVCQKAKEKKTDILIFSGMAFPNNVKWIEDCFDSPDADYNNYSEALFQEPSSKPFACNKIFRSELIKEAGIKFDKELLIGEDHAFVFDVFPGAEKITYIRDKLYFYRQHGGSITGKSNTDLELKIRRHVKVIKHVYNRWSERGCLEENRLEIAKWILVFLSADLFKCSKEFRLSIYSEILPMVDSLITENELQGVIRQMYRIMKHSVHRGLSVIYSLVLPVCNAGESLRVQIESVLFQPFMDIELIVVDYGSTDNSMMIAEEYKNNDPRIIILKCRGNDCEAAKREGKNAANSNNCFYIHEGKKIHGDTLTIIDSIIDAGDINSLDESLMERDRLLKENEQLNNQNNELRKEKDIRGKTIDNLKVKNSKLQENNRKLKEKNQLIKESNSYKIGRAITWAPRHIKK